MSTAPHPLDTAIAQVSEFPERLGPVLIKELRQGLRSGLFVLPFVVLPALLALVAVWGLSIDNLSDARNGVRFCFWTAVLVPVLVITPLRALGAIRSEREAQTLDLLQLTPLTAWRIVLAKWSSLMAQVLLWVAALLPFFVLRYFFGGMNLVDEGFELLWAVVGGGIFTAFGLVVSTLPRLVFWLSLAGLVVLGTWGVGIMLVMFLAPGGFMRTVGGSSGGASGVTQVMLMFMAAQIIYLALAFAGSRIAPLADNFAVRLRIGALALLAWFGLGTWILPPSDQETRWMFFVAAAVATTIFTAIDVTTARLPLLTHVRPWARFGALGIALGRAFLPGWPAAVVFFTGVTVLATATAMFENTSERAEICVLALIFWPAVLLPRALQCFFAPRSHERPALHLVLHIFGPLLAAILAAFSFILGGALFIPAAIFPSAMWWLAIFDEKPFDLDSNIITIAVVGGLWVFGLAAVFFYHSREYWAVMAKHAATVRAVGGTGSGHVRPDLVSGPQSTSRSPDARSGPTATNP